MADLSPELAARIQSLEASYADNPGRYFVALAGAWREGGDIATAEAILRENLKRFPSLSPHVLLGRCLADRGAFQEAANEFHYVLSIDSQNLIALRTLAEMAAAGGSRAEAERWYNELLSVDPMNTEARAALAQLARDAGASPAGSTAQAAGGWGSAPAAPVTASVPADDEFGMIDLSAPDASPADASGAAAEEEDAAGEWGDLPLEMPGEPAAPAEPAAAGAGTGGSFDAFGFGSVDLDGEQAAPASDDWLNADARQDVGESAAADAEEEENAFPSFEDALIDAPLAGADLPLLDAEPADHDAGGFPSLAADASEPGAGFGFGEETRGEEAGFMGLDRQPAAAEDDGPEHDGDHEVDAEMVTETMAELYAAQGLNEQAADVYRELIQQRGEEPGLVRRLAEIEARLQPADAAAPSTEPAAADAEETPDWLASVDAFASGAPSASTPDSADATLPDFSPAPAEDAFAQPEPAFAESYEADAEPAAASASADPFADSFAAGFDGSAAEPLAAVAGDAGAGDDRQPWQAPSVADSEPVGFDILVIEDEDGEEIPAPAEVVADVSADWAIAAAPLEDHEEEAEAADVGGYAYADAGSATASRTIRTYFDSLLSWQPGAAEAPTYEITPEASSYEISAAEAPSDEASSHEAPAYETPAFDAAPEIPTFDAPSFDAPPPAAEPADEPWAAPAEAAAEEEPWTAAPEAPAGEAPAAEDGLPLLDLEEPWAETPAAPSAPVDITSFVLDEAAVAGADEAPPAAAQDADAEELLPWETPAEPTPASAAPAPEPVNDGGGFSFEDFFASPAAPAAPAPEPEPEPAPSFEAPVAEPEPEPAFIPSFAPPTPPPTVAPPAPPAAAAEQDEEDEDLESFQAWLQSLKR